MLEWHVSQHKGEQPTPPVGRLAWAMVTKRVVSFDMHWSLEMCLKDLLGCFVERKDVMGKFMCGGTG